MLCMFVLLVILNRQPEAHELAVVEDDTKYADNLFDGVHEDELKTEVFYVDGHPVHHTTRVIKDNSVGIDRSHGVILDDHPDVVVIRDDVIDNVAVVRNPDHVVIHDRDDDIIINDRDIIGNSIGGVGGPDIIGHNGRGHRGSRHLIDDDDIGVVDVAALDRAVIDARNDGTLFV